MRTPIDRLKSAAHVNLLFATKDFDPKLARRLIDWLNDHSLSPHPPGMLDSHMEELDARRAGGRALDQVAEATNTPLLEVRSFKLLDFYRFVPFDMGEAAVSVDVLDAARELEMPSPFEGMVLEVFATYGREDRDGRGKRHLARRLVSELPIEFAFGGHASFTARYAASLHKPQEALDGGTRPQDFLWPLTFSRSREVVERVHDSLPVHHCERLGDGVLIQVFDNLVTGQEEAYRDAAHALGLRSVWELKPPRRRRAKKG
jgi:hypothetical protein